MTRHDFKPPAVARLLAWLAAPAGERADLIADLADEASRLAATRGPVEAARWYRRQVRASVLPLLRRRWTGSAGPRAWLTGLAQDLRLSVRALSTARSFTACVVLLLGIGIAAHTVVYAVVDAILLRPLPFGDKSDRLVTLHSIHPTLARDWDDAEVSYEDLIDLRRETAALEQLEGAIDRNVSISNGNDTTRELAASVTPGLLPLVGATPMLGRHFREDEAAPPGFESVTIVSYRLWETLLDRDPNAIGRTVLINNRPLTVVGVMPMAFDFPEGQQLWLPFRAGPTSTRANRALLAFGLLRAGVSFDDGVKALKGSAARLAERYPDTNRDWDVHVIRFRDFFVSGGEAEQLLLAVSVLLGVACANVAALMLARGISRQREVMLRAALGASRLRLFRLLATEGVLVTAFGGALGIALAGWGIEALVAWMPEPLPYWATPRLDARVVIFAALLTMTVAFVAGIIPALRLMRTDVSTALLPGVRAAAGMPAQRRLQRVLVVAQVAMSLTLLLSAVLLSRSATALLQADGGFDRSSVLSLRFYIAGDRYDSIGARAAAVAEVVRRVSEVPGVRAATATGAIPTDDGGSAVRVAAPDVAGSFEEIGAQLIPVTPEFWRALDLSLASGRTFTAGEAADPDSPSVIVNRRLAALMWPGVD
ncbi:MAG TPA: ABC transporter permease, partial [Vicinamibacterales bacterium]|nr:ABC transporter permease [Vicinamibacterales bacterium]